jgi:acyl carrier protein
MTFTREDTFDRVAAIIAGKLNIEKSKVTGQSTLQDLGADSLDIVEIIMKLEEQFGITINDADAEKLHTVDEVVSYVHAIRTK